MKIRHLFPYNSVKRGEMPQIHKSLQYVISYFVDDVSQGEHIKLCGFLNGFYKSEGFVNVFTDAVNTVIRPNDQAVILHLFSGSDTDLLGSAILM